MLSWGAVESIGYWLDAPTPIHSLLTNPFVALGFASVLPQYLFGRTASVNREPILAVSMVAPLPLMLAASYVQASATTVLIYGSLAAGAIGMAGYVSEVLRPGGGNFDWRHLARLRDALVIPLGVALTPFGLWTTYSLNPVYDLHLYAFDQLLGFHSTILGVASYRALAPLSTVASLCYLAVPIGIAVVGYRQEDPQREIEILFAAVLGSVVGFALYHVCPVVGPLHSLGSPYPDALPVIPPEHIGPQIVEARVPRNGMPSLHTLWALVIWIGAGDLTRTWRWGLRGFAWLNLWAAMGLADTHWIMDLVVAVPLTVAVRGACIMRPSAPLAVHWSVIGLCTAMTAAWLAAFRSGMVLELSRAAGWVLALGTVFVPFMVYRLISARPSMGAASRQGTSINLVTS